ncbi:MAG: Nudix family hydrolase [Neptuniibacter sp.]
MSKKLIHVAAAVIRDEKQRVLIAKRPDNKHQGGLWEFPGGKVEVGEPSADALARELFEELDINVQSNRPLIKVPHHYEDKSVLLDVYEVTAFDGEAWGKEGQPITWVETNELNNYQFPAANKPILNAAQLPIAWFITPEYSDSVEGLWQQIDKAYERGARAVMFRDSNIEDGEYSSLAREIQVYCEKLGVLFSANRDCELGNALKLDALHLNSVRLQHLKSRNEFKGRWLSASCHSEKELKMAVEKGLDFVTLSPVNPTSSHPDTETLGWSAFKEMVDGCPIPVYALGGMSVADIKTAHLYGAQGIAAISAWLES